MTAKEFLNKAFGLNELIKSDLEELENLRALSTNVSSPSVSEKVTSSKPTSASFENTVISIVDLENQIQSDVERMVKLKSEIRQAINSVKNIDEQMLLRYRYINFLSWENICIRLDLSMRSVHRMHSSALKHVKIPS